MKCLTFLLPCRHQGVVVFNMADIPIGFGVTAYSTQQCRRVDATKIVCYHQADVGGSFSCNLGKHLVMYFRISSWGRISSLVLLLDVAQFVVFPSLQYRSNLFFDPLLYRENRLISFLFPAFGFFPRRPKLQKFGETTLYWKALFQLLPAKLPAMPPP